MRTVGRGLGTVSRRGALAAALAVLAGHGGLLHPALDSIGHFRAHLAVVALALGAGALVLPRGRRRSSRLAGSVLPILVGAAARAGAWPYLFRQLPSLPAPAPGERRYTLLQMNLRFDADPEAALRRIAETAPDFVTVQEATDRWKERLAALADYPYQSVCARGYAVGGSVVLSRFPPIGPQTLCSPSDGFAGGRFDTGDGRALTVVSQHLAWPWPAGQWTQIGNLAPRLAALQEPVLLAGDFNAAPWSAAVSAYARQGGLAITRGVGSTWLHHGLPQRWIGATGLPIDHVLHSPGVEVLSVRPLAPTSSDHLPLLVTVSVRPAPPRPAQGVCMVSDRNHATVPADCGPR